MKGVTFMDRVLELEKKVMVLEKRIECINETITKQLEFDGKVIDKLDHLIKIQFQIVDETNQNTALLNIISNKEED